MADDRKPAATESTPEAAPAAKGGGVTTWLPLILAVVLMPVLAFGMTKFLIVPELQKSLGLKAVGESAGSAKPKSAADAKKISVPFNKLLVNIAGTMGARYLLVSVTVVGTGGEAFKTKVTENDAQLRDMAMGALSTKTLADLEKPGARNLIRAELINGFNNVLGDNSVQEIYITEFGIQ
ncbi:MAG: flagellar basal body-associated FliL family protein [Verrucomicrobiota bacterium]|jgi:flagellar FliL protein